MKMNVKRHFGELALPIFILAVSVWYLYDAYKAEASTENLLLILPAGVVVIGLCLWIAASQLLSAKAEKVTEKKEEKKTETREVSVLGAMIILAGYVLSMNYIGFDLATFLFILALMFLQGERRISMLIGFSLVFAFLVSLFFEYMIPYPMPMLIGKKVLGGLL